MEKKLYRVEVSITYYALATNREEAEDWASEAVDHATLGGFSSSANECTEVDHVYNFEDRELVYHEGDDDIEVREAFGIATGKDYAAEIKRRADAMRARMAARVGFGSGSSHGG
jgi:hypothetical protein